jgi:DNA (cytosine-5)-methyltransferase 3A
MNVLSLFDGISCARVALERAGIKVKSYTAVEIEKNANAISKKNYPDIVRHSDVRTFTSTDKYDLLIGGSPCTDLSIAKKDRKGLQGNQSSLFWEYVRIKKECKPTYFILENVASMPKADKDIITETLGVEPVLFNASLVSAQSRKRLFWTNIPFTLPEDKNILLKDILQSDVEEKFYINQLMVSTGNKGKVGHIGTSDAQANRVYDSNGKSVTLSANGGGLGAKTGLYKIGRIEMRRLDADGNRDDGNKDLPLVVRIESREDEKCGTLTTQQRTVIQNEDRIRKLTPIECERLQGLPDNYTDGIAMTNRYKCLGNAFNVDVVAHILFAL